jgi:hypothetical protein
MNRLYSGLVIKYQSQSELISKINEWAEIGYEVQIYNNQTDIDNHCSVAYCIMRKDKE